MLNSWTHEWNWLDFRKQHFKLTEQEAKAKFLLEQQKYEADMHTLYMQSINAPAGGGAASSTSGAGVEELWLSVDLDKYNADGRVTPESTNILILPVVWDQVGMADLYGAPAEQSNYFRTPSYVQSQLDDSDSITIDWGDGNIQTIAVGDSEWYSKNDWPLTADPSRTLKYESSLYLTSIAHKYDSFGGQYTVKISGNSGPLIRSISPFYGNRPVYGLDSGFVTRLERYGQQHNGIIADILKDTRVGIISLKDIAGNIFAHVPDGSGGWTRTLDWDTLPYASRFGAIIDGYDHSLLISIEYGFHNSTNYGKYLPNINSWDMSRVTNMRTAFAGALELPNISNWDVSAVRSFAYMFYITSFSPTDENNILHDLDPDPVASFNFVGNLQNWNLTNAATVERMFEGNQGLTGPVLETLLKAWADNPNTADNVNASRIGRSTPASTYNHAPGSDMDLAIQALTAKGWTISEFGTIS